MELEEKERVTEEGVKDKRVHTMSFWAHCTVPAD